MEVLAADARLLDAEIERLEVEQGEALRSAEELRRRSATVEDRLGAERARLRTAVLMLQQAGPLGGLRFMLRGRDAAEMAAGWRLAHELTRGQREAVVGVRSDLAELERVKRDVERKRVEIDALKAKAATTRVQLNASIRERTNALEGVRRQEGQRRQAIEELERAGRELGQVIAGQGPAAPAAVDIRRFKGLLPPPARGKLSQPFGDVRDARFGTVVPHRGWDIDAPFGADVKAVFDGRVVWSAWFRGYGLMVVVDHGNGVHSVYAHLSMTTATKGSEVAKGQSVGKVGDTGSLSGTGLYFEIRVGGKAEDPERWISRRR